MSNRGLYQTGLVFAILTSLAWIALVMGLMMLALGQEVGGAEAYVAGPDRWDNCSVCGAESWDRCA